MRAGPVSALMVSAPKPTMSMRPPTKLLPTQAVVSPPSSRQRRVATAVGSLERPLALACLCGDILLILRLLLSQCGPAA